MKKFKLLEYFYSNAAFEFVNEDMQRDNASKKERRF